MKYMNKIIPIQERPRERLLKFGAKSLADYELLAIVLRTGAKDMSVLDVAREVTIQFNNLNELNDATVNELQKIKGIGLAKAIELLAVVELGKRINSPRKLNNTITSPQESFFFLKENMQNLNQETLVCIYLNTKNEVICDRILTMGTLNQTIIHPREVLKWALKYNAYGFILSHNHPSGIAEPSEADISMTKIIIEAAKAVGIAFIDHIIVGKNQYFSFVEKGLSKSF